MIFSKLALVLSLAVSSLAAPTTNAVVDKRANVLTFKAYNKFQISDTVAGNALAEVNAAFPVRHLHLLSICIVFLCDYVADYNLG